MQRMAVLGAAVEMVAARSVRHRMGLLSEPYMTGRAGRLLHLGEVLSAAGVLGSVLGRRSRAVRMLSGAALLSASLATRFGIFEGGVESTKDPKYVVVPQRQRLAERHSREVSAPRA